MLLNTLCVAVVKQKLLVETLGFLIFRKDPHTIRKVDDKYPTVPVNDPSEAIRSFFYQ